MRTWISSTQIPRCGKLTTLTNQLTKAASHRSLLLLLEQGQLIEPYRTYRNRAGPTSKETKQGHNEHPIYCHQLKIPREDQNQAPKIPRIQFTLITIAWAIHSQSVVRMVINLERLQYNKMLVMDLWTMDIKGAMLEIGATRMNTLMTILCRTAAHMRELSNQLQAVGTAVSKIGG